MANNIQYICLSDMHLGEEDSLLTNLKPDSSDIDTSEPSPVMVKLTECLRFLVEDVNGGIKPILVLNGDILELALANTNEAAMVFERFMELVMPASKDLFERIIYSPGNHDHHFWESARETQYAMFTQNLPAGSHLPIPWHVTNMFVKELSELPPAYFLTRLLQRHPTLAEKEFQVNVAYPNFGILSEKKRKCVIFYHGHFIDPLYQLMSTLKTLVFRDREMPRHIWDVEAENFAWIDFFWSTMGRSGEIGSDVERIYEKMLNSKEFKKVLTSLAENLAKKYDLPGWGDKMEAKILRGIIHFIVDKVKDRERKLAGEPLSPKGEAGLEAYVQGPLREQILIERKGNMPSDVTLVFGHTHKPFEEDKTFKGGYPHWTNVYNTGGWVVDTTEPEPLHGASMVLIDEELNAASIRMYNQQKTPDEYTVSVEEAGHEKEPTNSLYHKILSLVDPSEEPWSSFSKEAAAAVSVRAKHLKKRIKSG